MTPDLLFLVSTTARAAAPADAPSDQGTKMALSQIGLVGLAVMGQNLSLNIAEKGFPISVFNRSYEKTEAAVARAQKEGLSDKLRGYKDVKDFVESLEKPRRVILLVQAGAPVDATVDNLCKYMEPGDIIIDGGNEWYENTERRKAKVEALGLRYMGMGVSGGEEGARRGPSMMPGGTAEAYKYIEPIVTKVAAQVDDGPCVMYIGDGGAGNYVKMVHNGIEYGDMQLISEAYDVLHVLGGLSNDEIAAVFAEWNQGELQSFLIEISAIIAAKKDEDGSSLVDKIVDKTGAKGTGKWTVQQAAELSVAAPTITASLDGRYMSALKDQRVSASKVFGDLGLKAPAAAAGVDKKQLIADVRAALYCSKICSYAQGMNIIKAKSEEKEWGVDLGGLARIWKAKSEEKEWGVDLGGLARIWKAKSEEKEWGVDLGGLARIWKGGCIIRAGFLDRIKQAYQRDSNLPSLLVDPPFAKDLAERDAAWRRVVALAVTNGVPAPGMMASLSYFDTYRRERLPANLVQAQRDFFGSHTYQRTDKEGWFHTVWDENFGSADSITTSAYNR
ncbi:hypothetical protein OEZ85_012454 [Tetradesmus obliquus]|uniref:6-phosphogluconate dehydrogenase, decarboxylating n=1 Tax=Tetradesmus obliquus TaxID=3088 RepID=A0ABY8TVH9_TETOB|nr:hypothetical protein OEZ85_012454 [Tetradesmus obliquus]